MKKHYHQRHLPGPVSYGTFEKRAPGLKKGVGNSMFWSEFGEPHATPPPKIPRSTPSPSGSEISLMFGEEFYFTFTQICFGVIGSGFSAAPPLTSGVGGAGIVSFQATAGVDLYLMAVVGGNVYNV